MRLLVLGTGLVGTSVALAARAAGADVALADRDPGAVGEAVRLGAGRALADGDPRADLAVIAVPPVAVPAVLRHAQDRGLARWFTDVAGVKARIVDGARSARCDQRRFVPGHPMAGGERSGPGAARADLFAGRTWVLCPQPQTDPQALRAVRELVGACGAEPVETSVEAHDRVVALVSHAPHVVSSALAAALVHAPPEELRLAGPGLRDMTRIAAGSPEIWTDILTQNAKWVAPVLVEVAATLLEAANSISQADGPSALHDLLARGVSGRQRLRITP